MFEHFLNTKIQCLNLNNLCFSIWVEILQALNSFFNLHIAGFCQLVVLSIQSLYPILGLTGAIPNPGVSVLNTFADWGWPAHKF